MYIRRSLRVYYYGYLPQCIGSEGASGGEGGNQCLRGRKAIRDERVKVEGPSRQSVSQGVRRMEGNRGDGRVKKE